jgi:antibiotic biosynthesis monooxygenase (ABM) superfamily enzyme
MLESQSTNSTRRVYRVDRFVVPNAAREEFLARVRQTHDLLRTLPGFMQDFVLEAPAGPDELNVVTVAEWDSPESVENAKAAVIAMRRQTNFDPQEMFTRLGIRAELANYRRVD